MSSDSLPAGWKLVPLEPTQEMCVQGQWKAREWPKFPLRIMPIYAAMLAVAPEPPEARADSAVPSSHVSETDRPSVSSDRAGGEGVRAPRGTTEQMATAFNKWLSSMPEGPQTEHARAWAWVAWQVSALARPPDDLSSRIEPFVVKRYSEDERPSIKGNGFDGLQVGEDRKEAHDFIDFVNAAIAAVHHEAPEPNHPKAEGESILREALARLVALKDLKMQVEALAFGGFKCEFTTNGFKYEPKKELHDRLLAEYNRSKGPAWEAARSALAGMPKPETKEA